MFDSTIKDIAGITKITAALAAVFFLLLAVSGCCHNSDCAPRQPRYRQSGETSSNGSPKRPRRKRAGDYSRLPGNTPAHWQHSTLGR